MFLVLDVSISLTLSKSIIIEKDPILFDTGENFTARMSSISSSVRYKTPLFPSTLFSHLMIFLWLWNKIALSII